MSQGYQPPPHKPASCHFSHHTKECKKTEETKKYGEPCLIQPHHSWEKICGLKCQWPKQQDGLIIRQVVFKRGSNGTMSTKTNSVFDPHVEISKLQMKLHKAIRLNKVQRYHSMHTSMMLISHLLWEIPLTIPPFCQIIIPIQTGYIRNCLFSIQSQKDCHYCLYSYTCKSK